MRIGLSVTWVGIVALAAAVVSACGSNGSRGQGPGGDNGDEPDPGGQDATAPTGFASGSSSGGPSGGFTSSTADGGASTATRPHDCDPSCAAAGGTCAMGMCSITENPANASPAVQAQLKTGGSSDSSFSWLYPYDRTVFARGIVSPTLQFAGSADTLEVHITSTALDYTGYFKPAQAALNVALSQKSWQAVTGAVLGTDTVKVAVTKITGGTAAGPITESWRVAQGSLHGTVYHETYNSPLAGAVGIMRIDPGATQPTVLKSGCGNVCHTASADGSTLVADTTITTSASYDLRNNASVIHSQSDDSFAYAGLYPDGSILMSSTDYLGGFNTMSRLYDTKTGSTIAAMGWDGVITKGGTTSFSPDGKQIAFVHEDKDQGHTLAKMDFNLAGKAFSNLTDLATDPSTYAAWPSFTPDGNSIVYHAGSSSTFTAGYGSTCDLFMVDIATKAVQRLDALDGYTGPGTATYLPSKDTALSCTPTALPEIVGGYYWVIFTSHRSYGNLLATNASSGTLGKLWVAAIDVNAPAGQDPSHPAFYLDGQEINADNLRGFWTLPPCQQNGTSCATGDQCCTGFCRSSGGKLACVPPPTGCSQQYEKCSVASDCCDAGSQCTNGLCADSTPR
ncbi:MAG TPA: hypothetical protein VK762_31820 [Polyangiaceae bacterium]|nr:hypothetical protein [Polyangiaceae bacterium]